jgi:sentrin-specific protease 1
MSKRLREEEESNRNNKPSLLESFTAKITKMSFSAAFNCITSALGFSAATPSEYESLDKEITLEQTQTIINEQKQKNELPIKSQPSPRTSSKIEDPIKLIRAHQAQEDERKLFASLHSSNSGGLMNFGNSPSELRKTSNSFSSNRSHYRPKNTPFKSYDYSGESSAKVLTPTKLDLSEDEILPNPMKSAMTDAQQLSDLRKLVSLYNDKNITFLQARRKRQSEEDFRKAKKFLTQDQEKLVSKYYREKDYNRIYITINNIDIKYEDLLRIGPGQWLNDEIINCYMSILNDEGKRPENVGYPKVHCFNTFFYVMLLNNNKGYMYQRVAKWTKSFDVFALDFLIIPIHVGNNHWCLSVINIRDKRVEYYDSMGGKNLTCMKNLKLYIADEYKAKKEGKELDMSDWETYTPGDTIPQQDNIFDCGVFMCQFAESITSGNSIAFVNQVDMPYYRKRMMLEILHNNKHFDK